MASCIFARAEFGPIRTEALLGMYRRKHGLLDSLMRESEELRLLSYNERPVAFLHPKQMVSAGLYFTQYTDLVCCPFCNIVLCGWRPGDDPFETHTRLSPSCTFINQHAADYTDL
jgi:hypothetical protein